MQIEEGENIIDRENEIVLLQTKGHLYPVWLCDVAMEWSFKELAPD